MRMRKKITSLVRGGYKEAAFSNKENAIYFANLWKKKGYDVGGLRSAGPTVEGKVRRKAYYIIARKKKKKKGRK